MMYGKKNLFAKGRMKSGERNGLEARYEKHLEALKQAGEILWYEFEGMTFKIAEMRCKYTPDFNVMTKDNQIECHELKGNLKVFQDDAKVKAKVAADKYPIRFLIVTPKKKDEGGGWNYLEY